MKKLILIISLMSSQNVFAETVYSGSNWSYGQFISVESENPDSSRCSYATFGLTPSQCSDYSKNTGYTDYKISKGNYSAQDWGNLKFKNSEVLVCWVCF